MAKSRNAHTEAEDTAAPNRKITIGEKKKRAEHLFLTTDLSQDEISDIVQISNKTMSKWVNADDGAWKVSKAARSVTKEKVIAGYYQQLYQINLVIEQRPEGERFPTSSEADTIAKLSTTIERLEKSYQFGTYYQVVDELMEFISKRDQEAAAKLALHSLDFVKSKTAQLNGKNK